MGNAAKKYLRERERRIHALTALASEYRGRREPWRGPGFSADRCLDLLNATANEYFYALEAAIDAEDAVDFCDWEEEDAR